jgi:excisionase family DNA binding protein
VTVPATTAADPERLAYTVDEALRQVPLGRTAFYAALKTGQIRSVLVGRRRLIPRSALIELLEGTTDGRP